eukprot:93540-Pleurochrysis_carterae.AAC.1
MALILASELGALCASASACRAAVSRARISASMAGRGSSMRTQLLPPAFRAVGARLGETLSYGSRYG